MAENFTIPPLKEAVCEFKFKAENWDPSIAGLLYPALKDIFPKKESVQEGYIEFFLDPKERKPSNITQSENELPKFANEIGNLFVIFRKNIVSIHCINPYVGWQDYLAKIKFVKDKYDEIAIPGILDRLGLRYINRISLPDEAFSFSDYFKICPTPLENSIKADDITAMQTGVVSKDHESFVKTQFVWLTSKPEVNKRDFVLDIDYFSSNPTDINSWLETAHQKIEEIFLNSMEQKAIDTFK